MPYAPSQNIAETVPSSPTFNAETGVSSTENYVSALVSAQQEGTPALTQSEITAGIATNYSLSFMVNLGS